MGRSLKVRYALHLVTPESHTTSMAWRTGTHYGAPGYGRPTAANIKRYIGKYNKSLRPGEVNAHIGRRGRATGGWVVDQNSMKIVAEWKAPMFSTDESDFDVLYKD